MAEEDASLDTAVPADAESSRTGQSPIPSRWIVRCGCVAFAVQFIAFGALSVVRYRRFSLGTDFAIYGQAWTQIGRGHLNPQMTIYNFPYLKNNLELITWPLALVYPVFHSPIFLLWVQDAAIVGASCVTFVWVVEFLQRRAMPPRPMLALSIGVLVVLLLNPETYATAALDFHFEPMVALFAVLAARDLWNGHRRRPWLWLVLCLLCGDIGGLVVVGVGLSAILASRDTRRAGVFAVLLGLAWVAAISLAGANEAANLQTGYAYLAGRQTLPAGITGGLAVLGGVIRHPGRPIHTLTSRWSAIYAHLRPVGVIGVLTPWGFGVPAVALLSAALQHNSTFIVTDFQNVTVLPFVLFGTVVILTSIAARWKIHGVGSIAAVVLGIALFGNSVIGAIERLPRAPKDNAAGMFIPGSEAAVLRRVLAQTPHDAEVIASVPIVGRFAQRPYVYQYLGPGQRIPVRANDVIVVLDTEHAQQIATAAQASAAVASLRRMHARLLVEGDNVLAVEWHPPHGTTGARLP